MIFKKNPFNLLVLLVFLIPISLFSQNMLDASTWVAGNNSAVGFSSYGSPSENSLVNGHNHIGEDVVLWESKRVVSAPQDGGWSSNYQIIDHTKTYRLAVWMKKTNSNNGTFIFHGKSYSNGNYQVVHLNGNTTTISFFFSGDLPELDKWYLLVGFIHPSNYTSSIDLGRMYDGITGEEVMTLTDFKFTTNATNLQHRCITWNNTNTNDRQYGYDPRMELVNGNEQPINTLLSINEDSKLIFAYDNAGNQTQRYYCIDAFCIPPNAPTRNANPKEIEEIIVESDVKIEDQMKVFPNPTRDIVNIKLEDELFKKIESINVYDINSSLIQNVSIGNKNNNLVVDLKGKPSGVYFIHIHLNDGSYGFTKKIIKE